MFQGKIINPLATQGLMSQRKIMKPLGIKELEAN